LWCFVFIAAVGSGGHFAQAAALALIDIPEYDAEKILRKAMQIAGDHCIYTNHNLIIEAIEPVVVVAPAAPVVAPVPAAPVVAPVPDAPAAPAATAVAADGDSTDAAATPASASTTSSKKSKK
jgi:hypothetical protein